MKPNTLDGQIYGKTYKSYQLVGQAAKLVSLTKSTSPNKPEVVLCTEAAFFLLHISWFYHY